MKRGYVHFCALLVDQLLNSFSRLVQLNRVLDGHNAQWNGALSEFVELPLEFVVVRLAHHANGNFDQHGAV